MKPTEESSIEVTDSRTSVGSGKYDHLIRYYEEAGPDYEMWSPKFNMHFGFYKSGMNPFKREEMLDMMNRKVLDLLIPGENDVLLDLGCGLGATSRYAAQHYGLKKVIGVTIVPWQVKQANELIAKNGLGDKAAVIEADYTAMPFEEEYADGAFALESMCHAESCGKEGFIREMHRVLKRGKRFAIADGFLKKPVSRLGLATKKFYKAICHNWALSDMAELALFTRNLEKQGFGEIKVEDVSWKVAPSVAHAPFVTIKFLLGALLKREKLGQQSKNNLRGALLTMLLGLHRAAFGYYIISGVKLK
jgi:MPBQ/MSBQ methyltransferase